MVLTDLYSLEPTITIQSYHQPLQNSRQQLLTIHLYITSKVLLYDTLPCQLPTFPPTTPINTAPATPNYSLDTHQTPTTYPSTRCKRKRLPLLTLKNQKAKFIIRLYVPMYLHLYILYLSKNNIYGRFHNYPW